MGSWEDLEAAGTTWEFTASGDYVVKEGEKVQEQGRYELNEFDLTLRPRDADGVKRLRLAWVDDDSVMLVPGSNRPIKLKRLR